MKGTIIQRSKGSWTLVFDVGRDGQGKRQVAAHMNMKGKSQ